MTVRDDYYGVERWDVLPLISNQARTILDVGSGNGATMSIIKKKLPRARIVGVELNKSIAASSGDMVLVGDIQATELREELAALGEGFDCILALDVLEHFIDPWEVLRYLTTLLNPGGYVLISLPNLSNVKSLLPLLFLNRFEYQNAGILDRTHLRFFTRREAIDLVEKCELKLRDIIPTGPVSRNGVVSRAGLLAYVIHCLSFGRLERFVAHQYVLRASLD